MSDLDLDAIERRNDKAHQYIAELCSGNRRWTMTVPVDIERDTDTVLGAALSDNGALVTEVRALRERVATLEDGMREIAFRATGLAGPEVRTTILEMLDETWEELCVQRQKQVEAHLALLDASHDQEWDR